MRLLEKKLRDYQKSFSIFILVFTIVISPHLLGGVTGRMTWTIGVLSALSFANIWFAFSKNKRTDRHVHGLMAAVFLAWFWTCIHCVPIPCLVMNWLDPEKVSSVFTNAKLLEQSPPFWCVLSTDPGATVYKIIQASICLSIFLSVWILVSNGYRKVIFFAVCVAASTVALSSLVHSLIGAETLYGIYKPQFMSQVFGPILNANNAAGFFLMTLPLIGSYCFEEKNHLRVFGFLSSAIVMIVILLSLSRWAIAVLFAGAVLFILTFLLQKKGSFSRKKFSHVVPAFLGVFVLALSFYVGQDRIFEEYKKGDLTKIETIEAGFELVKKNPVLGVGRGGFSAAFVQHQGTSLRYEYAENFLVQWFVEWGVPFTVFWLSLITLFFVRRWIRTSNLQIKAALLGLAFLMFQNLMDFSIENTSVALMASVLLAVIGASPKKKKSSPYSFPISFKRFSFISCMAVLCAVVFLGMKLPNIDIYSQAEKLEQAFVQNDRTAFRSHLRKAIALHPSEPLFPYFAGTEAVNHDDPKALRWLSRAMWLAPKWDGPHQQVAVWLWKRGHNEQALLEIREVAKLHMKNGYLLFCSLVGQAERIEEVMTAAPKEKHRHDFMQSVLARCVPKLSLLATQINDQILLENPANELARIRRIERKIYAQEYWNAWIENDIALGFIPDSSMLYFEKSKVHNLLKQYRLSLIAIDHAASLGANVEALASNRARIFALMKNTEDMRIELEKLLALRMKSFSKVADTLEWMGDLEKQAGHPVEGIKAYERAYEISEKDRILRKIAFSSNEIGLKNKAFRAFRKLCQKKNGLESDCSQLNQLKFEQEKNQADRWKQTFEIQE